MKKCRIIIAGGRIYTDYEYLKLRVCRLTKGVDNNEIEIVSGGCDIPGILTFTRDDGTKVYGVDGLGERLAKEMNWPIKVFMADWKGKGRSAGPLRNEQMAIYSTHGICFWDKKSKGTKSMIDLCEKHKLNSRVIFI